ncbi:MAG: hypothetical protein WDW36_008163 [Sanguina aurantia]
MLQHALDSIGARLPNAKTAPSYTQSATVPGKPALPPSSRHSRAGINLPLVPSVTLPSGLVISKTHGELAVTHGELAVTHGELAATHWELAVTHGDLAVTHGELAATHGELAVIHGELAATHGELAVTHGELAVTHGELAVTHGEVIKGCLQLDGRFGGDPTTDRTSGTNATADFDAFVEAGITTFDVADVYGSSEAMLGQYFRLFPHRRDQVQVMI